MVDAEVALAPRGHDAPLLPHPPAVALVVRWYARLCAGREALLIILLFQPDATDARGRVSCWPAHARWQPRLPQAIALCVAKRFYPLELVIRECVEVCAAHLGYVRAKPPMRASAVGANEDAICVQSEGALSRGPQGLARFTQPPQLAWRALDAEEAAHN